MERVFFKLVAVVGMAAVVLGDRLQCKNPDGQPVDWFTAIKLPKLRPNESDGTVYVYMDANSPEWTYLTGVTTEQSAVGHTVAQMYAPTESYNDSIVWLTYNDASTNGPYLFTFGHSKGVVVADKTTGFWLVHSVPKFPLLPFQNNSYSYPKTGQKYGQSFLCMSMLSEELDKVGGQLINNEARVYGSHFGSNLKEIYPSLFKASLPLGKPNSDNDGVRIQHLRSINGSKFLSVSKSSLFGKDLYQDLITKMVNSNVYTETWLNSLDIFNSSCSGQYKTMNIKSLVIEKTKGSNIWFKSLLDHSKWVITDQSSKPWICIGDINRAEDQLTRGGGTVCINSFEIWNKYNDLIVGIDKC